MPVNFSPFVIMLVLRDRNGDASAEIIVLHMCRQKQCFLKFKNYVFLVCWNFVWKSMNCSLYLCLIKVVRRLRLLETVVNYFADRGSPVYVASLDESKACNRVNHFALFIKSICLGIPLYILNVFLNWHLKLTGCVRYLEALSVMIDMKSGVRQGGIKSLWFLNIYTNGLIS